MGRESTLLGAGTPPPRTTAGGTTSVFRNRKLQVVNRRIHLPRTPAEGTPPRGLRRAASKGLAADPRRSSQSRTNGGENHHHQTPPTPSPPPQRRRRHTPRTPNSHSLDPGIPRPPAAGAAAGGEGSRGSPARNRSARRSPKESPFPVAGEKKRRSNSFPKRL